MTMYAHNPQRAVVKAIEQVMRNGTMSSPRGQDTYELLGAQIRVDFPAQFVYEIEGRDLKHGIGILEGLQLVAQTSLPSVMTRQFKVFARWTDGSIFDGAYGVRAHGMIRRVIEQIDKDRDTRQAVITIFDSSRDLHTVSADVPCTLSLQFVLRQDQLHMITTMRSNDVWRGLPYDLMQFMLLQHVIADHFGVQLGTYTHNVGSLHLYGSDLEQAEHILAVSQRVDESFDFPRPLFTGDTYADAVRRAELLLLRAADQGTAIGLGTMTLFEGYAFATLMERAR